MALWTGAHFGCGDDHPPRLKPGVYSPGSGGDSNGFDAGLHDGPPDPDASGLCGNQIHKTIANAPNLYFVLDASGSMAVLDSGATRYDRVRIAVVDLVRKLGPLINVGAALFPSDVSDQDSCHAGEEVFPVTPGDPFVGEDMEGPTTKGLRLSTLTDPVGGTPTGATLAALTPTLTSLPGETIVLLATDGGPNCNPQASCTAAECMSNLEGTCDPDLNCCAPNGVDGPIFCVDRAATVAAVEALASAGIKVYVIGIPGSELYADVLDEMAIAGGAPQQASPFYYRIDDVAALGGVFSEIASVVISCEIDLIDPPPEEGQTNVYLDQNLLLYDPVNGWRWTSPSTIELVGDACERLKSGQVGQVQIVSGCPTEVPL